MGKILPLFLYTYKSIFTENIMSNTVQQITDAVSAWQTEDEKFVSGNSAAGTRARKALQEIAKLVKARRAEISEEKNVRKANKESE
jgi:hypothetical protein